MKKFWFFLLVFCLLCPSAWAESTVITEQTTLQEIMDLPAFSSCASWIFDREARSGRGALTMYQMRNRYAYYDPSQAVDTLNVMARRMEEGSLRWIPLYTGEECAEDASLREAGLFYFEGMPRSPFAVVCPGGGFEYVSAMTEGFPHALYLNEMGVHAFVLHYRTGMGEEKALDDLKRALEVIGTHADAWRMDVSGYAIWGASAGATIAAMAGNDPAILPGPAAIVLEYTDITEVTDAAPPTFGCAGQLDDTVSWKKMAQRMEQLSDLGIPAEFHLFPELHHGFGLGLGTQAEGWIEDAITFWMTQREAESLEMVLVGDF
ncbi:MAG: alpha/beta hydrolase [Clostridia bacterium]|nr:alpha/beta hydrolase [Clostridia bacterium]